MAHIIVVGNEKGGSGKSTTSMHVATALCRMGHRVGALDLDLRQKSFGRYIENRRQTSLKENVPLPTPQHLVVPRSPFNIVQEAEEDERERFLAAIAKQCPKPVRYIGVGEQIEDLQPFSARAFAEALVG